MVGAREPFFLPNPAFPHAHMKLRIQHTTVFSYKTPITEAYTEMRLAPTDDAGQRRTSFHLVSQPRGDVLRYADRYGNEVHYFDVLKPHDELRVTARSEVHTADTFVDDRKELSPLDRFDFLVPSSYAPDEAMFRELAEPCVRPVNAVGTALALTERVHGILSYVPGATDVKTKADEALRLGRGVCQDFAHVMIAACRSIGLPARYVSGYLNSPGAMERDDAASHAWVDVFTPDEGWVSVDPTHNCRQNANYVRLAVGRDYADVPPTRGVFKGSATEQMDVSVRVEVV
jgi:transglutaminase-like putative cysteine protease